MSPRTRYDDFPIDFSSMAMSLLRLTPGPRDLLMLPIAARRLADAVAPWKSARSAAATATVIYFKFLFMR